MSDAAYRARNESISREPVLGDRITLVSGAPGAVTVPEGATEVLLSIATAAGAPGASDWQISFNDPTMSNAIPVPADLAYTIDGPIEATTVWVQQDSGGPLELRWSYLRVP